MLISFPLSQSRIIAASAAQASHTGTTDEAVIATVTIPAGIMGLNGILRVSALFSGTSSANNKIYRVRFGGLAGTLFQESTQTTGVRVAYQELLIANRGAANSQLGRPVNLPAGGTTGSALVTASLDTTAAQSLVFTGHLVNSGETITLEMYLVELLLP